MDAFHIFAHEDEGNMGDDSEERARIAVATDSSLDEGAVIRMSGMEPSPLAGDTSYFLGLDGAEAHVVHAALIAFRKSDPDEFANYWGDMVLSRLERLVCYIQGS